MVKILLIDDEKDWLQSLRRTISGSQITSFNNIFLATDSTTAFEILKETRMDLIFLDLIMNGEAGETVLSKLKISYPNIPVVIMTGVNSITSAVNCTKLGALDYFIKTTPIDKLVTNIKLLIKLSDLVQENTALKQNYFKSNDDIATDFKIFITKNQSMIDIFKYLEAIKNSNQPILITGESGVGKGVLAKAIASSSRPGKPFVALNVAGLDNQMFSDTLFGHVKGAYTGADQLRHGMIKNADDGTLFLDEIGELTVQSQIKLLYLTQDGEYQQLGSDKTLKSNARFIFATNQDIENKIEKGEFRRDLFFRLNTHRVNIPSLRDRKDDVELLINYFLGQAIFELHKCNISFSNKVMALLMNYDYPGNVRQLRAMIYDFVARTESNSIISKIAIEEPQKIEIEEDTTFNLEVVNNNLIKKALEISNGNQVKAANMLGISQSTLSRKLANKRLKYYA